MPDPTVVPTDRRALLAGIGGLAAGTLLGASRAEAGPLTPPSPPSPTGKPLAEVEPRIAVNDENTPGHSTASFIITKSGSYYLAHNVGVGSESVGVLIEASNVTLDLNGFSIIGKDSTTSAGGVAVAPECSDVMVHNGFISDCRSAVYGEEAVERIVVRNVHARNAQWEAIFLPGNSVVEDCTVMNGGGIAVAEDCRVSRCLVQGGGYLGISAGTRSVVESNKVTGTAQEGISVRASCVVEGNVVHNCASGIHLPVGNNAIIRNNTVLNNTVIGLRVDTAGNTISGNTVRGNGTNYQFVAGNQLELLISQIPQTLSWPCTATLQGRLNAVVAGQNGITISSENVRLDLAGHELRGGGSAPSSGIAVLGAFELVVVRNGTVSGWASHGVDLNDSSGSTVEEMVVNSCGQFGIRSGIASRVQRCRVQACQSGIRARERASVTDCRVDSCEQGGIELVANALAERNDLRSNEGAAIHALGSGSIVRDNIVVGGFGTGLKASAGGNTFSANIVRGNVVNYDFVADNQLELLISQIPQTLSWPCKATVTGTLTGVVNQHGITVASNDVAIDLGGHALVGGGGESSSGIHLPAGTPRTGISIRNGQVRGWTRYGVEARNAPGLRADEVTVAGNAVSGFLLGDAAVLARCAAESNGEHGFDAVEVFEGGTLTDCTAGRNGFWGFRLGGGSVLRGCRASHNNGGFRLDSGGSVVDSVATSNSGEGFRGGNVSFAGCSARFNQAGFYLDGGSITASTASQNSLTGISAIAALVSGNKASGNGNLGNHGSRGGIFAMFRSRIEGNHCVGNGRGIVAQLNEGCIIQRNTCAANGTNWDIAIGNAVAPIQPTTNTTYDILGDYYGGGLGSTDPNANFTH